jgi:hypothetical protein
MTNLFNAFIDSLDMNNEKKEKIKNDVRNNWMCEEWCMQFINAGRLPVNNEPQTIIQRELIRLLKLHTLVNNQY